MNLFTFDLYKNKEEEDYKKLLIHNELRDLIKTSNSFTYYHIYNFYILNIDYLSIEDLFKNMIFFGNIDGLDYLTKSFHQNKEINGLDLFSSFYSYLLNSITNINNIPMYQYILETFPHIKPTFYDIILAINYGNIDILHFFINNFNIVEPNDDEIKNFDIKDFLEKVKEKKNVSYIRIVFDIIQSSNFLQNIIIKDIGKNIDFTFISKKYFIEAIMKSMIDNSDINYSLYRNISYSYNA